MSNIIRFIAQIALLTLIIMSFPLICLVLLAVASRLSEDEVWLFRVLMLVFGPFASCLWFALVVRAYQRNDFFHKFGYSEPKQYGTAAWYAFMGFLISLLAGGYVAFTQDDANPTLYFLKAVVACFSPSLLYLTYRIFRTKEAPEPLIYTS